MHVLTGYPANILHDAKSFSSPPKLAISHTRRRHPQFCFFPLSPCRHPPRCRMTFAPPLSKMPYLKPATASMRREKLMRAVCFLAGAITTACVMYTTGGGINMPPSTQLETDTRQQHASTQTARDALPYLASKERMRQITDANTDLVYLPASDILFMTLAKGGTTSTWNWVYRGVTGLPKFNMTACETYVQNVRSHCWAGHAVHLFNLSTEEQWRVLTSSETLRVAIQRNPFERIVSSYKSKFTCEADTYGTDLRNRATMVPQLRRQAGWPEGEGCMNISEFALALDSARVKAGTEGHRLTSLRNMDVHVRPQEFYFDEIGYDIVLDVKELGNVAYLQPIIDRLKYKDLVKDGIEHRHKSGSSKLMIAEDAARMLYSFALESKPGKSKVVQLGE